MDENAIASLKGVELEYAFAKAMGYEVLGCSEGPFALWSVSSRTLAVIGGDKNSISFSSFSTDLSDLPLEKGQELGAVLSPQDSVVICRIGGLEMKGHDYLQALMRALVLHLETPTSQQP